MDSEAKRMFASSERSEPGGEERLLVPLIGVGGDEY